MQQNQKKNNMQGFFFLTKLVEQQQWELIIDHVGTMEQWEQRMATSMWRVSCVFLVLLLALPTTKIIL